MSKTAAILVLALGAAVLVWWARQRWSPRRRAIAAIDAFRSQRAKLEKDFYQQAAQSGKPRGLRWKACEFAEQVLFAKALRDAEFAALCPCTISFEAIPGGGMEEVEAVGNLRAATAVFLYRNGGWAAEGRVLFNLSPEQALERLSSELAALPT